MTNNDGGPAFPCTTGSDGAVAFSGMSLRDWFAGMAMQAYISKIPLHDVTGELGIKSTPDYNRKRQYDVAASSYCMADAMLEARNKQTT